EVMATLPLRLTLGVAFIIHGYPKLAGPTAKQARDGMKTLGVPPVVTTLTALLEFVGGIALILGFLTPIASFLLAIEMVATTILSKNKLQKKYVLGYELDIAYAAGALSLLLLGGGPISIDALLGLAYP
ncbi:MAG: DoxX family protein, partial [Thaumarchaeota archaeon]|nr:DoxX family protein [Nitrososphaerota archaeon]